ncbi:hypothetical protein AABB24_018511, partial [Solanum stoloniferum]
NNTTLQQQQYLIDPTPIPFILLLLPEKAKTQKRTTAPNDTFSVRIHGKFTPWTRESVLCNLLSSSPQRPYPYLISQQQQASTHPAPFLFRNGVIFRRKSCLP